MGRVPAGLVATVQKVTKRVQNLRGAIRKGLPTGSTMIGQKAEDKPNS